MCGIAGGYHPGGPPARRAVVAAMADTLAHRGPDAAGVYLDGPLGLGHRRLAILDLRAAANQPMSTADGSVTVVYNGEIYNHLLLRQELERTGRVFRTRSDTELLLHGYLHWGIDGLVGRLNGMAAFALWDQSRQRLHLVRDRYGIKPLYLWRPAVGGLFFASEIKAFLAHPDFRVGLDAAALNEYFTFQNLLRHHTLFVGVEMLPPGHRLTLDADGERLTRYWDFDFRADSAITDLDAAAQMVEERIVQSVESHLMTDVPLGAYLSGGMDSGSMVAVASRHIPRLTTFTAGFELSAVNGIESTFDERAAAELMAYHFKTEHYEQVINAGDIAWALPRVIWHLEDLRLGMSYPNYYISRLASKFVTVCLSGAGGDEMFGGYPWRYFHTDGPTSREEYLRAYYGYWQRLVPDPLKPSLFTPAVQRQVTHEDTFAVFRAVFGQQPALSFERVEDQIASAFYFESKTFLHGLFVVGDKLSMANGLEERFPFMDNAVVEAAQRIPVRHKLGSANRLERLDENLVHKRRLVMQRHADGKRVLRQAMAGLLPAEVLNREKQGFSAPDASWYRGENANYVRAMLLGSETLSSAYIDRGFIHRMVDEHMRHQANHRLLIWSLLCFEWWCRIFLDGQRPQPDATVRVRPVGA